MEIKKEFNDYIIKLNNHEVLVFFEWLVKFVENNGIIDEAEKKYYMTQNAYQNPHQKNLLWKIIKI